MQSLNRNTHQNLLIFVFLLTAFASFGQGDPLSLDDVPMESVPVKEAFNGPNVIYGQSTNMLQAKRFDLVFGHRFGKFNEGAFNAFGLDQAFIRIGCEYGITDWLTAGIGRSSLGKNFDMYVKHRPLVQTSGGGKNIPVSVMVFLSSAFSANELRRQNNIHESGQFVNQLVYTMQSAVSRQFSPRFSAQVTTSMVHRNSVPAETYDNKVYGVGAGIRVKLSERIHLLGEYTYLMNKPDDIYDPFAIGIDIVAGGHVFNVHATPCVDLIEKGYLTATTDKGLRLGFSIRRSFLFGPKVEGGKVKI